MQGHGRIYRYIMLGVLAGWASAAVMAQTPYDRLYRDEAAGIREQVELFSDRSIYSVDEIIHFTAEHRVSGPVGGNPWSSVLYVELITSGGQPLAQAKYPLSGGRAEGTLTIPDEALTGDYYLKSYTRWMRNTGPRSFNYVPLKIINPFREEVVLNPEGDGPSEAVNSAGFLEGLLECSLATGTFPPGADVRLQLKSSTGVLDPLRCCVTVVPEGAQDLSPGNRLPVVLENDSFRVRFLPDLGGGVSISGTVIGPDELPIPYATLHISVLGESPDFFATMTDEQGRFVLSFPEGLAEKQEFFVTPEQDEEGGMEVRIDEEFDTRAIEFPGEPFRLDRDEMETARKVALNMQLLKVYRQEAGGDVAPETEPVTGEKRVPFYGTRVNRLLMDDYVLLPNLKEVFINLVPEIQFYKKKGENRIRFVSANKSIGVFSPLIMMDHVSIFDHQALLDLSPEKIERIDLINDIYLKGNVSFGGVLAIYSRKGDMAGIDLPVGSYFFDYQSFNSEEPVSESLPAPEGRIPDTRNTLFWQGDLQLEPGTPREVTFQAPAHSGRYVVLVRGMLPNGELYSASAAFNVE